MTSAPESGTAPVPPRPSWLDELSALLPAGRVSTRTDDLLCYRRDAWARGLLAIAAGQPPGPLPAAIVWPRSVDEVEAIVRHCRRHRVPLTPFGAGSGVTGGAAPSEGGLTMDLKGLRALRIDPERMQIAVEPGLNGWHLEDALRARGLTLGHFPSSIMCSTVGGWVATRGAGQMSTKYGKIEDMVRALTVVTGDGHRRRLGDGGDGGIDLVQALIGSEGTLGVITEAVCSVRRAPAARVLRGYWFPDVESGLYGIRHLVQHGLVPAVVRLYDEIDTLIAGMGRGHVSHQNPRATGAGLDLSGTAARLLHSLSERVGKIDLGAPGRPALDLEELVQLLKPDARRARGLFERWATQLLTTTATPVNRLLDALLPRFQIGCVLILGCEGEPELAEAEASYAREELTKLGARDLGPEPGERWLRKRYDVSFKQQKMYAAGALVDTIEVAATWDRLPLLHRQVRSAIGQHALVMAHFSHAYPDGCSIYFSFVMRAQSLDNDGLGERARLARLEQDRRRYDTLWRAAMTAALHAGGTISHHHGIGRVRAPFMAAEHGDSVHLLAALKRAADPDGILNPGKLLPPELQGPPPAMHGPPPAMHGPPPAMYGDTAGRARGEGTGVPAAERPQRGARIGPIQPDGLLVEVEAGAHLGQIERALRRIGLSVGGLPPRAWLRPIGDALLAPRPSEACLDMGRLRDRRARLQALLPDGRRLTVPPQPVPRRAAGPDLGALLLGGGADGAELLGATLRVQRRAQAPRWSGHLLSTAEAAVQALHAARTLHGSTALQEIVLLKRAHLAELLESEVPSPGEYALLVSASGPVAATALQSLHDHLRGRPDLAQSLAKEPLPEVLAAAAWSPTTLFEDPTAPGATPPDVAAEAALARHAARFPEHEAALDASLAEQAALIERLPPRALLCGVYLHGLAVCSPEPLGAFGLPRPRAGRDEPPLWSAQNLLSVTLPEASHV
ncbi:MAG: FAD-binding oxidoreductase [Polyangia bacterium]